MLECWIPQLLRCNQQVIRYLCVIRSVYLLEDERGMGPDVQG